MASIRMIQMQQPTTSNLADWVAVGKFVDVDYAGPFIRRLLVYFLRLLDGELGSLAPGSNA